MSKIKNYIGQTFGYLMVEGQGLKHVITKSRDRNFSVCYCTCKCGAVLEVLAHDLVSGHTKSCGCYHKEVLSKQANNYVGNVYDRLTVLNQFSKKTNQGMKIVCVCECICGTIKEVLAGCLKSKKSPTRSCGCLQREISIEKIKGRGLKEHSEATIQKMRDVQQKRVRDGNHNWYIDGRSREKSSERLKEMSGLKYKKWRTEIFTRDNYTCQMCGVRGGKLSAHHIKSWNEYPDLRYDLDNGQTLCTKCHTKTDNYGAKSRKTNGS